MNVWRQDLCIWGQKLCETNRFVFLCFYIAMCFYVWFCIPSKQYIMQQLFIFLTDINIRITTWWWPDPVQTTLLGAAGSWKNLVSGQPGQSMLFVSSSCNTHLINLWSDCKSRLELQEFSFSGKVLFPSVSTVDCGGPNRPLRLPNFLPNALHNVENHHNLIISFYTDQSAQPDHSIQTILSAKTNQRNGFL